MREYYLAQIRELWLAPRFVSRIRSVQQATREPRGDRLGNCGESEVRIASAAGVEVLCNGNANTLILTSMLNRSFQERMSPRKLTQKVDN